MRSSYDAEPSPSYYKSVAICSHTDNLERRLYWETMRICGAMGTPAKGLNVLHHAQHPQVPAAAA